MNNTINRTAAVNNHGGGRRSFVADASPRDSHAGSVEQTPSWFGAGKFAKAFGCIALASVMLVGCTDPNAGHHTAAQQDPVKQEQVLHPQAQPKTQAAQLVSACATLKDLNAKAVPTDSTEAASLTADKDLAKANCQIEIAQKQTEAAERLAAATEKQAEAQQKAAAAAQKQADILKRQEDFKRGERAAEAGIFLGKALGQGINDILR